MDNVFKTLRKKKRLSQKELSEKLRIAQSEVSKLENGEKPSMTDLQAYAGFFKVSMDYLTGRSKVPFKSAALIEMAEKTHLSEASIKRIMTEGSSKGDNRRILMLDWILSDKDTFNGLMDCMIKLCFPASLSFDKDKIPADLLDKSKKYIVLSPERLKEIIDDAPEELYREMRSIIEHFTDTVSDRPAPAVNHFHPITDD